MPNPEETPEVKINLESSNFPDEFTVTLANLLRNSLGTQSLPTNYENMSTEIKLNSENHSLLAALIQKTVGGRRGALTSQGFLPPPPSPYQLNLLI